MRHRIALLATLSLAACFPQPQPTQPTPQPTAGDIATESCHARARVMVQTYCTSKPSPLPSGWAETARRSYDGAVTPSTPGVVVCPAETMAPVLACVNDLEAQANASDPERVARRDAARPKADKLKHEPSFRVHIDDWLKTYDAMTIACAHKQENDSYYRTCTNNEQQLSTIEDRLRAFLVKRGFDPRDFTELGLWPTGT